jgi:hypothetical protein
MVPVRVIANGVANAVGIGVGRPVATAVARGVGMGVPLVDEGLAAGVAVDEAATVVVDVGVVDGTGVNDWPSGGAAG